MGTGAAQGDTKINLPPTHPIDSRARGLKRGAGRGAKGERGGREGKGNYFILFP